MNNYEIEFYCTEDGKCPVKKFLSKLDVKMLVKIKRGLDILSEFGTLAREPYSKALDDGVFELRTKVSSDITRILYFFYVGKKIILTNGFVKKTQKTPMEEIKRAKLAKADYERRNKNERF